MKFYHPFASSYAFQATADESLHWRHGDTEIFLIWLKDQSFDSLFQDRLDLGRICARIGGEIEIMNQPVKTLHEVSLEARHVLYERLGVSNTVRFFNQFEAREGNYTEERDATCEGASVGEIADRIQQVEASRQVG